MRLYLLCCALLLSGCSPRNAPAIQAPPQVPPDLLMPCPGYTGPLPQSDGQLSDALVAEVRGRECANGKLAAVAEILNRMGPQ